MYLNLIIGTDTLGDSDDESARIYAEALQSTLKDEYPDAEVVVKLGGHDLIDTDLPDDADGNTVESIRRIANDVWENNRY
jgi:hypothetical protein